jgi:hypothetical protein
MIVYDLECGSGHRFEGWFASKDDFSAQSERGLVGLPELRRAAGAASPVDHAIQFRCDRAASRQSSLRQPVEFADKDPAAIAQILYSRLVDEMLQKSEDVGAAFPEEARRIHYQQAPARSNPRASNERRARLSCSTRESRSCAFRSRPGT